MPECNHCLYFGGYVDCQSEYCTIYFMCNAPKSMRRHNWWRISYPGTTQGHHCGITSCLYR